MSKATNILIKYVDANQDTTLIDTPSSEPPALKGYLNKYTNVARGYGTRWFVLKDGVLSCRFIHTNLLGYDTDSQLDFRFQDDEQVASRGFIAMKTATLKVAPGGEKTRFEIQSAPTRSHSSSGAQKWYLKANHPVEASRWTQAIAKSIEWYKREGADGDIRRKSGDSDTSHMKSSSHHHHSYMVSISSLAKRRQEGVGSGSSFVDVGDDGGEMSPLTSRYAPNYGDVNEGERNDDSSAAESTGRVPPYDSTFDLHGNSITAQMELTSQLLSNLSLPPNAPARTHELKSALKDSFTMVQGMINEYVQMAKERDEWWRLKLQREQEAQTVWEESLQTVVREGEALEKELRTRSRKRGSRFFDTGIRDSGVTFKQRPAHLALSQSPVPEEIGKNEYFPIVPTTLQPPIVDTQLATSTGGTASPSTLTPTMPFCRPSMSPGIRDQADDDTINTDEEDEFFDAIETNNIPNLDVHKLLSSPTHSELYLPTTDLEPYAGYKNLRDRLPISSDNRPSTSLWSVLKHSIGKDLTKISFPVFFNEPTSMLQRMVRPCCIGQ